MDKADYEDDYEEDILCINRKSRNRATITNAKANPLSRDKVPGPEPPCDKQAASLTSVKLVRLGVSIVLSRDRQLGCRSIPCSLPSLSNSEPG